ncbi:hypothetical protein AND_009766 [Anopheles darlingi]|uniref:Uncharacterized protein n=1 Tax=Anopheles darlingi TaxID=43151 RepID=W5J5H1_ANODA|nr:hypothetical protein AND_009766 [Anopheles darlingi]
MEPSGAEIVKATNRGQAPLIVVVVVMIVVVVVVAVAVVVIIIIIITAVVDEWRSHYTRTNQLCWAPLTASVFERLQPLEPCC